MATLDIEKLRKVRGLILPPRLPQGRCRPRHCRCAGRPGGRAAEGGSLHGLHKTLGKMLAEGGATTRQIMDTLGHTAIAHAELYSREAEQERLASDGMKAVVKLVANRKKQAG